MTPSEWTTRFAIDVVPTESQIYVFTGKYSGSEANAPIIQEMMIAILKKYGWFSLPECPDNYFKPDPVKPYSSGAVFRGLFRGPVDHISLAVMDGDEEEVTWGYHPKKPFPASRTITVSQQEAGYEQAIREYWTVFDMLCAFDDFIRAYVRKD
jgi:hypothetical protein